MRCSEPPAATLSPERLDDLCSRTEGWAAGLVLAGLSLERASDPDGFVDSFRGDDQLVVSYLSDELLDAMSAGDRRRLLETAVLDHLTGPLIDAVTGSSDGTSWLADIANRNQLIVRLDIDRRMVPLPPPAPTTCCCSKHAERSRHGCPSSTAAPPTGSQRER